MAERRMFAKTIVFSDAFLDMPMSARCLYFTLGMFADDDGFVNNPKSIMRQCGASMDDMNILMAKKFVIMFESGIIVIKHWRIHNYIRQDTYNETKYQDEKKQLSLGDDKIYRLIPSTERPRLVDESETQVRIGKDRIGKDNILPPSAAAPAGVSPSSPSPSEKKPQKQVPYQKILEMYYELCPHMSAERPVNKYTDEIKKSVKARFSEYSLEDFETVFRKAEASDFLNNRSDVTFQASFDWLMRPKNFSKALNGNFDNIAKKPKEVIKGTDSPMSIVADGTRSEYPETEAHFE